MTLDEYNNIKPGTLLRKNIGTSLAYKTFSIQKNDFIKNGVWECIYKQTVLIYLCKSSFVTSEIDHKCKDYDYTIPFLYCWCKNNFIVVPYYFFNIYE